VICFKKTKNYKTANKIKKALMSLVVS